MNGTVGESEKRRFAKRLFSEQHMRPLPDQELSNLVWDASQYLKEPELVRFFRADMKYNTGKEKQNELPYLSKPVGVMHDDAPHETVYWYFLRKSLELLPEYGDAAHEAGLTYMQGVNVLTHALYMDPYDFTQKENTILLLSRVMHASARNDAHLRDHLPEFRKMIALCSKEGIIDGALYGLSYALDLGMSFDTALPLFMKLAEADGSLSGYVIGQFNTTLKSFKYSGANPQAIAQVMDGLGGPRPYYCAGNFALLEEIVTFDYPTRNIAINELLHLLESAITKSQHGFPLLEDPEAKLDKAGKSERMFYFNEVKGELAHANLPYQNKRSFEEGHRDLEKLAVAKTHLWEEVGEGLWVADVQKGIWYSLGGKLEVKSELFDGETRVRHHFNSYDLSKISDKPFLFHIHPEALEIMITPFSRDMKIPELHDHLGKFLAATPSRSDYGVIASMMKDAHKQIRPRAAIVHSVGTTELLFPQDVAALESMAKHSQAIRDLAMLSFDAGAYFEKHGRTESKYLFVERMMGELNRVLPEGFSLKLYPRGMSLPRE